MKKEVDELKNIIDARQAENEQIRNEADDWKNRFETSERSLEEVRAQLSAAQQAAGSNSKNKLKKENHSLRQKLKTLTDQNNWLSSEVDQLKQVIEQQQVDSEQLRNEVHEWEDKFKTSQTSLEEVKVQLSAAQKAAVESGCKIIMLKEENKYLKHRMRKLEMCDETPETLTDQNDSLHCEVDQQKQVLEEQQVKIEQPRNEVGEQKNRYETPVTSLEELVQQTSSEQAAEESNCTNNMLEETIQKLQDMERLEVVKQQQVNIEQLRNEADEWKDKFEKSKTSLETVRVQLSAAQQAAEELNCTKNRLEEEKQYLQQRLRKTEICEENQRTLTDQNKSLYCEVDKLKEVLEQQQVQIEQLTNEADDWKDSYETSQTSLEEVTSNCQLLNKRCGVGL
ncbi:hypothetical protein WMY93_028337 [Mugilogobius chulae]|uniref:Uncharacterized protein n=1 Tax=Mugilogobius chulae TaxID=88201 RepID=A0AAW0MUT3_9GOBI